MDKSSGCVNAANGYRGTRSARRWRLLGEVRIFGLAASTVASVTDPNSQAGGSLLPLLYDARVTTMQNAGMLIKGEE
ncbi:hypothetical protein [Massilia sp. YIM B02443]|uniref:hypothetical protein n=1 Tax=Massilia sp. YIM B02443 TaxID=3050127 RepID=UPI0025B6A19D|nr:hypothetical protein [Massilia sp. YIM B02443]MDN4039909.1 hypothetical protein [Massilia sp. YIM B02443]